MKRLITEEMVTAEFAAGRRVLAAPRSSTIVTPGAWTKARELGVTIEVGSGASTAESAEVTAERGTEREVDSSGVTVVRGGSARLSRFAGAGPDKNVGLVDLVTAKDGSPMTAGVMSWSKDDSFAWSLDYDEIDLVLEGVLRIEIDGRALEGRVGDVFYIPKGSRIVFATPSRTRVFYVTYPADWNAAAPARPQR